MRLKADFLRLVLGARVDPARQSLLIEFVEKYIPLDQREAAEFEQLVTQAADYKKVAHMIAAYEQRGIEQGQQKALLLVMEKKCGPLGDAIRQRILEIHETDQLERLLVAVLDAQSLGELEL